MILDHYFGDNEVSGIAVGYSRVISRSGEGKREAEKACRDHRQRSAEKIVNSFQQGDTPNCIIRQIQTYKLVYYNAGKSFCLS
jgi:hypothetical protein